MRLITGISILVFSVLAFAGPNEDAKLFFDFNPGTDVIDSVGGCPADSTFTTSIKVHGASNLYDYQIHVNFDTSSLEFIRGKADSDALTTMLEKNGGSVFFNAGLSIKDSTQIRVGCTLLGNESNQCVSDSGLLCLLTFKHKKADTTELSIESVLYEDCDETIDTALHSSIGIVLPVAPIRVIQAPGKKVSSPIVRVGNGTVSIDFRKKTEYVLTAVNTLGRKLYSNKGFSETVRFDGHMVGKKAYSSGLIVVRICSIGNKFVIPLVQ
jgi:hypothetical protein